MRHITIQKNKVEKQKGIVILPLKEYEKMREQAIPTYYLTGKAAQDLDKLVEDGLKEHRAGKTVRANSLDDALRIYERREKKSRAR